MRGNFRCLALLTIAIWLVSLPPAHAAEPAPGSACPTVNLITTTGGPETSGVQNRMICDGTTWQVMTTSLANGYTGIKTSTPAAALQVNGEAIIGNTGLACSSTTAGGMRYNSSSGIVQVCDGSSWQSMFASTCDNAPAYFPFTDQNSLGPSTLYTSNIVQITGMDAGCTATVGVSGTGTPQYQVCSDAACSTVTTAWTASNNSIAMQGKYIQVRATTSATAGATTTTTVSIGPVSVNWNLTVTPTNCSSGAIGTVCANGSVYAGLSPDGNVPMYITRCDAGQSWSGSACTGSRENHVWNNGLMNWADTPLVNCGAPGGCDPSGKTNTATLVAADSDNFNAGVQIHDAANYCDSLSMHSQTDWYLPSAPELNVIYGNVSAIGNFNISGPGYWSSSEATSASSWYQWFNDGVWSSSHGKNYGGHIVRCARR